MSRRLTIITVIALMILLSLTLAACEKERPVPTPSRSTPQTARGTVAATTGTPSTPSAALTKGTAPAGGGTRTVQATPIPVGGATSTTATAPQPVVVSTGAASGTGQSFIYTVVAGDTLAVIASRFNTTPEGIVQLNGLKDANMLALGQQLKIPGKASSAGTGARAPGDRHGWGHQHVHCAGRRHLGQDRVALRHDGGCTVKAQRSVQPRRPRHRPKAEGAWDRWRCPGCRWHPQACDRGAGPDIRRPERRYVAVHCATLRPDHEAAPGRQQHHQP